MSEIKEYIVTLHNRDDLDEFYQDMETLRATKYNCMPERTVEVAARRPTSRNTHYWMTEEEAVVLRQDPRVRAVELKPAELGMVVRRAWTQTSSDWNKSLATANTHLNWGLLRSIEGQQRPGWGVDGTPSQTATVEISEEGRNVDVIIVDGHFDPAHPEFAVNSDGTGGSRVIQLDWHTLTATASGINDDIGEGFLTSSYVYTPYTGGADEGDNNHGAHVAGTVAGSTQGWARKANVYNISPYGSNPNVFSELVLMDYIRAFHNTKAVNPATGRRNPTICNHSWGYGYEIPLADLLSINFRGSTINGPFTAAQARSYGLFAPGNGFFYAPSAYTALDADVEDAIADGIIMVAAASNDYTKIDVLGGQDYNNFFTISQGSDFYNRGSSPGRAAGVICVGSIDILSTEYKADYSNSGPRIDIWAPGTEILSSVNSGGTADIRNNSYQVAKYSGTSMASPQVCGVLACILETYPSLTPAEALDYITRYARTGQLTDTGGGLDDYQALQGAPNLYLAYNKERALSGNVFPKLNYKPRPTTGAVYPRIRRQ